MKTIRRNIPLLALSLALQGCTLDFDTAFEQPPGGSDAALADQAAGDAPQSDAMLPDSEVADQALADRVEAAQDVAPDVMSDVAPDLAADVLPEIGHDVVADTTQDVVQDTVQEVAADVLPDALPDAPPDVTCPANTKPCDGQCVALDLPEYGCAKAGCAPCSLPNAVEACQQGACAIDSCENGRGNCNSIASDGCETSLTTTSNCGGCGTKCALYNASETCATGVCKLGTCISGWGNCDNDELNGCETNLETKANCGSCGTVCNLPNANESCSTGECRVTSCQSGWGNCDQEHANGCEATLVDSPNCGACGETCQSLPNVESADCLYGGCKVSACSGGWGNCDGSGSNGCEADLNTDMANCGGCGAPCKPTALHYEQYCDSAQCTTSAQCSSGWADCDSDPANGCESFSFSDPMNCGGCGTTCGTVQICAAGKCVDSCADAGLGCTPSPTVSCGSSVAVVGQYNGGSRTVCIDRGDDTSFHLAVMSYDRADWVLTGAIHRLYDVQVYSTQQGVTCVGALVPVAIQVGGSVPANPYTYSSSMGDCPAHTGYAGAVFGIPQSEVCHMNCVVPSFGCLSVNP